MDPFFKNLDKAGRIPVVPISLFLLSFLGNVTSILSFVGVGPFKVEKVTATILMVVSSIVLGAMTVLLGYAIYRVYAENKALRRCFYDIHRISHYCRDTLLELYSKGTSDPPEKMLGTERIVLNEVCRMVSDLFWELTKRKCHVCITLVREQVANKVTCFTWSRSDQDHLRNVGCPGEFEVSKNTRLQVAMTDRPDGPAHFFCADLRVMEKEKNYLDEFANWKHHYLSCIVIPVRFHKGNEGTETIGFLKIETAHTYRLNGTYHVQLAAAFADTLATFLAARRAVVSGKVNV